MDGENLYGNYYVRVTWTESQTPTDTPVNTYTVIVARPKGAPISRTIVPANCTNGTCTVNVPAVRTAGDYTATVYATNTAGNSPDTTTTLVIPGDATTGAQQPRIVTGVDVAMSSASSGGQYRAIVSWHQVVPPEGALPVLGYRVTIHRPAASALVYSITTGCSQAGDCTWSAYVVSAPGDYVVSVTAYNAAGNGPDSESVILHNQPPSAPTGVTLSAVEQNSTNKVFTVRWNAASVATGTPITGYVITLMQPSGTPAAWIASTSACSGNGGCSFTVGAFTVSGSYQADVRAISSAGNSPESSSGITWIVVGSQGTATNLVPPAAPQNTRMTLANGVLTFDWDAGGADTVSYLVKIDPPYGTPTVVTLADSVRSYRISNVSRAGEYSATVWASNAAGNSAGASPRPVTLSAPADVHEVTGQITGASSRFSGPPCLRHSMVVQTSPVTRS